MKVAPITTKNERPSHCHPERNEVEPKGLRRAFVTALSPRFFNAEFILSDSLKTYIFVPTDRRAQSKGFVQNDNGGEETSIFI